MPPLMTVSRIGIGVAGPPPPQELSESSGSLSPAKVVRKLPLRTLMPIEDTLRTRGGLLQARPLAQSASAPALPQVGPAGAQAAPDRRVALPEVSVEDTDEFVAWYRKRELHQRCTQHCGVWDAPISLIAPSAAKKVEVMSRIKGRGWTQLRPSSVWVSQARELALHRAASACGGGPAPRAQDGAARERLRLLEALEAEGLPQGVPALLAALRLRCGSLKEAYRCLGGGARPLTLPRFAGGVALLGLDAAALCGASEREALKALDGDRDERLSLQDMLAAEENAAGFPPPASPAAADWWVSVGRFIALSAWFCTPLPLRSRGRAGRPGEGLAEEEAGTPTQPAPQSRLRTPLLPTERPGESEAMARQQALDALRRCWAPQEEDLASVEKVVLKEFAEQATSHQFGEKLLSRSDFLRLLGSDPLSELAGGDSDFRPHSGEACRGSRRAAEAKVCSIYDEVLAFQAETSHLAGRGPLTKGLTFESLRLALFKLALVAGLHFRHLVEDAVDALTMTPTAG